MAKNTKTPSDETQDEDERDEKRTSDAEDDEDEEVSEKRAEASDDEEEEARDASTVGVAKALGLDKEAPEEEAADGESTKEDAVQNRAARRRTDAVKRRARREAEKHGLVDIDDEVAVAREAEKLPLDKNARARELLKRRQEGAAGKTSTPIGGTLAVQDSLARAGSATTRWLRKNYRAVAATLIVGVGSVLGVLFYLQRADHKQGEASDALAIAMYTDRGYILKEDKRPEEEKKLDFVPAFTTMDARDDAAIAAYAIVINQHPDTGPALLAKLGQAGAFLEKGDVEQALLNYSAVSTSALANADPDVKGRALEGLGYAKEAKKDPDGALATFKELEGVKGFEDLAKYHQARLVYAKGDVEAAKTTLQELSKKLEIPTLEGPQEPHLQEMINEQLRAIDPKLAKNGLSLKGPRGSAMSPEELEQIQKQMQEAMRRKQEEQEKDPGHDHGGE